MAEILLFSVIIEEKHFQRAMDVPNRIMWAFHIPRGTHAMVFTAFDIHGRAFTFRLSTWRNGRYRKPVICIALLRQFLHVKGVRVNDKLTWYTVMDPVNGVVTYRVRVRRHVFWLLGQDVWIDLEDMRNHGAAV